MSEKINIALTLMGVGMVTVFLMLFLVVILGNVIIHFVNKFLPETVVVKQEKRSSVEVISASKMAAIVAAVQSVTGGKGRVENVEKKK